MSLAICFVLDCFAELYDNAFGFGGPAIGNRGSQREARTRGEEEPTHSGERRKQETVERD